MSTAEYLDVTLSQIQNIIAHLQSTIPNTSTLIQLLSVPLATIGLLPPRYRRRDDETLSSKGFDIDRHIPPLQRALLEHVIPNWEPILSQEKALDLVEQYFCPDSISFASPAARRVALHAYSTILSLPLTQYSIRLLARLCKSYPIDVLHSVVYSGYDNSSSGKHTITWEDCVRNVAAIPAKVANAVAVSTEIPHDLEQGTYFDQLSMRCEHLMHRLSSKPSRENAASVAYLLTKLVNIGVFPSSRTNSPSQPSFFRIALSTIRARLAFTDAASYSAFWSEVLSALASTLTLQTILASLFAALTDISPGLDASAHVRALVKREAQLLRGILGRLRKNRGELVDSFTAIALGRDWNEGHARIFACWAAGAEKDQYDAEALDVLFPRVTDMWTTPDHIRHSLLSRHHYMTTLFLTTLSYFPPSIPQSSSPYHMLALSPPFISSISTYISHLDSAVRRCGMLVGEEVARGAGKKLDFGDWEGEEPEKQWARRLRDLLKGRDADADLDVLLEAASSTVADIEQKLAKEILDVPEEPPQPITLLTEDVAYDSDDSLTGYASPSSSRSPSPTPSELDEIEKDPTLRVGQKKVPRPVYLAQLGEMIRSTSGLQSDQEDVRAQQVEVALDVAEELIRRKSGYGTELEENAVNLTYGLIGLQDNYDIDGFDEKRQAALTALVACCPRKAAPALIEEFFRNQYSTNQRFVILNALVLGARELASLPLPEESRTRISADRISFPSKRLPPALHERYLTASDQLNTNNPAQLLLEGISQRALQKGKEAAAEAVPAYVRERQLRIRPPAKVSEVRASNAAASRLMAQAAPPKTTFVEVAAEFFICPLINRFWLFLRDEQAREARTAAQPTLYRYRGAGTGLVLSAMVLSRFLAALAVLVHTARNAKEWLAIIAPDALELAVTLGTRPVSMGEGEDEDADEEPPEIHMRAGESERKRPVRDTAKSKEAAVLTTALELALVVLDGSLDLDGGRTLGLEHTALLFAAGEWAKEVYERLEQGVRVLGGGGVQELALRRAAAGVLLKVDELSSKWKRSMIDIGSI
ncbi:telomeric DNA binding protein [Obba rivulosa]|uniref:Telomeric DNA binding protein n=1 Tax=Obba rivulosa TaxID=1052685 RepID=A0A8E2J5Z9_9APHY|nr:telomeric DNA binding protein [Obba rivulosa]